MSDPTSLRVLIVEDDYLVAEMIQGVLEEYGYIIAGRAMDGKQAVAMTRALRPDVVLMDVHLPVMDGIDASKEISLVCPTPIVVVTAYQHQEMMDRAMAAGVGAFLVKPPNESSLTQAIHKAIAHFRKLHPHGADPA